jgi:hypothetical protein
VSFFWGKDQDVIYTCQQKSSNEECRNAFLIVFPRGVKGTSPNSNSYGVIGSNVRFLTFFKLVNLSLNASIRSNLPLHCAAKYSPASCKAGD